MSEKGETSIDTNSTVTLTRHELAVTSTVMYLHEDSKKDKEGWSLPRKETQPREQLELTPALQQDMVILKITVLQRLLKKKKKRIKIRNLGEAKSLTMTIEPNALLLQL